MTSLARCRSSWLWGALASALLLWVAAACDRVPLLAPSGTTITLFATNSVLPVNGSTEITATVIESAGTAVQNGTLVTFATSLGNIEPRDARTHNGQVTVKLFAGSRSGTAQVTAISGSASSSGGEGATGLEIVIGGAGASQVTLSATPAAVPSTGATVQLTAVVTDAAANPLPGVSVAFSTTAGALASATVVTGSSGAAHTSLSTNRAATVTARVGEHTAQATIEVTTVPVVAITSTTQTPTAGQPVSFTVSVTPAANSSIRSVEVDFGDGESQALGALNGTTNVSHVYAEAGTYTASATASDSNAETVTVSTVITVVAPTPLGVTIQASPSDPQIGTPVTFTATVTPATAVLRYDWSFGDSSVSTTTGNQVSHVFSEDGQKTVSVTVTAVDGAIGFGQTVVNVAAPAPFGVTVTPSDSTPATGTPVTFTASVAPATTVVLRYDWNFGDSSATTTTGSQASHVYSSTGQKTVTVTVTAVDGTKGVGQTVIVAQSP